MCWDGAHSSEHVSCYHIHDAICTMIPLFSSPFVCLWALNTHPAHGGMKRHLGGRGLLEHIPWPGRNGTGIPFPHANSSLHSLQTNPSDPMRVPDWLPGAHSNARCIQGLHSPKRRVGLMGGAAQDKEVSAPQSLFRYHEQPLGAVIDILQCHR